MFHRHVRIPVWLVVGALVATLVIGSKAAPKVLLDVYPSFRIVTPGVSDIITQDITPDIARNLHLSAAGGVLISDVLYSPLHQWDVILSINGNPVGCQRELDAQLAQVNPGDTFFLEVYRNGRTETVTVQRAIDTPAAPLVLNETNEIRGITVASLSTQNGVIVQDVQIGTSPSDMGLRSGDIILEVDGHPVHTADEFLDFMRQLSNRSANLNVLHTNGRIDVFVLGA